MMDSLKVYYLFHSGFAVQSKNSLFIFDYYNNISSSDVFDMEHGVINPMDIKDLHVYVFVSHSHYDHYNSIIFTWANVIHNIHYIVSPDVTLHRSLKNIHVMAPHEALNIADVHIETLNSNDLGVAYLVTHENATIFHSGDLNWWYGDNPTINEADEKIFKTEYDTLKGKDIDLAFIPVSPRLKGRYAYALDYFLKNIASDKCHVFPMHFGLNVAIFSWLERDGFLKDSRVKQFYSRGSITLDTLPFNPFAPFDKKLGDDRIISTQK